MNAPDAVSFWNPITAVTRTFIGREGRMGFDAVLPMTSSSPDSRRPDRPMSLLLQDRAALYVSGSMSGFERECFECVLEEHDELRRHVAALQDASASVAMAAVPALVAPRPEVKNRLLRSLSLPRRERNMDALVVADAAGRVDWVNSAFTDLCGYTLEELRGRKPGHLLQGPATDVAVVERIRKAVRQGRPCRETLVNYHKDGRPYTVDLQLSALRDEHTEEPVWFMARERKIAEVSVPA